MDLNVTGRWSTISRRRGLCCEDQRSKHGTWFAWLSKWKTGVRVRRGKWFTWTIISVVKLIWFSTTVHNLRPSIMKFAAVYMYCKLKYKIWRPCWHILKQNKRKARKSVDIRVARFFEAYSQNGWFLKTLWPKSQNILTMVISIFIGVSNCSEAVYFLPKKCGFAKEARFYPKTTIFAENLKLPVTTCLYLS